MTTTKNEATRGFDKGKNNGTEVCRACGKRTWKSRIESTGDCKDCYDAAGDEIEAGNG